MSYDYFGGDFQGVHEESNEIYPVPIYDADNQHDVPNSNYNSPDKELYPVPVKAYNEMSDEEKVLHMLNEITLNKDRYWLAHSDLTDQQIEINIKDFLKDKWANNPLLTYEPRLTLTVYLNEIKRQYIEKNPENEKTKAHEIVVPFAWSDWVDLTMLNQELSKEHNKRTTCKWLKSSHRPTTKNQDYCLDLKDITAKDLTSMSLPSTDFIPGFAVKDTHSSRASNEVRMLEAKSHLLTYAHNPSRLVFLSKDGIYEAQIEQKKRLVDSKLFENYLNSRNIQNYDAKLQLNPVKEFEDLTKSVFARGLDPEDDIYGIGKSLKNSSEIESRQVDVPESAFIYQYDDIVKQIEGYEERLSILQNLATNELLFDLSQFDAYRLQRHEFNYLNGLKRANSSLFDPEEETYFKQALLNVDKKNKNLDNGANYDWKFFNGATRSTKRGWSKQEQVIREKISMHRLLRNWFKFVQQKGLVSWVAHSSLFSWYWDGLLFPFNEGIHIQMPINEVIRLTQSYNQTLIIEDVTEGYGKYMIDCSPFLHIRDKADGDIEPDVKIIDIDTGMYISITGLGISTAEVPDKYQEMIRISEVTQTTRPVYNSRNGSFAHQGEISPLKLSQLDGVPVYIPNQIEALLKDEYGDMVNSSPYRGYYFVDALNLWVPGTNLTFLFDHDPMIKQDYKSSNGKLIDQKFTYLLQHNMTSEKISQLFNTNQQVLIEYYLTKDLTEQHQQELKYLFETPEGDFSIPQVGPQLKSIGAEYRQLTSQFKFDKPLRRPLFNYEHIDRRRHHQ